MGTLITTPLPWLPLDARLQSMTELMSANLGQNMPHGGTTSDLPSNTTETINVTCQSPTVSGSQTQLNSSLTIGHYPHTTSRTDWKNPWETWWTFSLRNTTRTNCPSQLDSSNSTNSSHNIGAQLQGWESRVLKREPTNINELRHLQGCQHPQGYRDRGLL